jgi:hypothetical protein
MVKRLLHLVATLSQALDKISKITTHFRHSTSTMDSYRFVFK